MRIMPVETLLTDLKKVDEILKNEEAIHLTHNGYGKYVLMSEADYDDLLDRAYILGLSDFTDISQLDTFLIETKC